MALIYMFIFTEVPQAMQHPLTVTYKQGVYDITPYAGMYGEVTLLTLDKPVTIMQVDSKGKMTAYENLNAPNSKTVIGPAEKGASFVVIGAGEVMVTVNSNMKK